MTDLTVTIGLKNNVSLTLTTPGGTQPPLTDVAAFCCILAFVICKGQYLPYKTLDSNEMLQVSKSRLCGIEIRQNLSAQNTAFKSNVVLYRARLNTLLKSNVTRPDHVVRCRGSQECGSRFVNFACQFHRRWHRLRITLKSTTLLFMRSSNV